MNGWIKHIFVPLFLSPNSPFFLPHSSSHPFTLCLTRPILNITDSLFSATHAHARSMPWYIGWVRYLSWFMYSNEASTIIQWRGVKNISKFIYTGAIYVHFVYFVLYTTPSITF